VTLCRTVRNPDVIKPAPNFSVPAIAGCRGRRVNGTVGSPVTRGILFPRSARWSRRCGRRPGLHRTCGGGTLGRPRRVASRWSRDSTWALRQHDCRRLRP
jgi:hypothetical protein